MLFTPELLTIAALGSIRRIILELFTMISGASLTLAGGLAANRLIWAIAAGRKGLVAIRAAGKAHVHQSHR
jgi:hypothetical protein